ncbi:hypothetical protein [Staphylococcus sp. LKG3-3]|uniref:hypothetical protein n=1 Tax=Staphylococcus sp. LKG3-3 TaxID=3399685 RepID=UPI003D48D6CA
MVITKEDIINRFNCSGIRAQKFIDAARGDMNYLEWLIEREEFKQNNTPAITEFLLS